MHKHIYENLIEQRMNYWPVSALGNCGIVLTSFAVRPRASSFRWDPWHGELGLLATITGSHNLDVEHANTEKLIKQADGKQCGAKSEKYNMGKSRKYTRRQILKILAAHMMNHHMAAGAGGGRHQVVRGGRRPPSIMWPLVFAAFASTFIFCFGPILLFLC